MIHAQVFIAVFVLVTTLICLEPVRANFALPFGKQQKKCMENNALLLEHVDTLEKENIALRHVHAKNLNDLAEATDRLHKMEGLVNNLRVRNTEWAVKINDMKQQMNALKLQRMAEQGY